ncbi:MAG: putative teichuronic acid biosynthesis glycosyltransferase TuaH [Pelotomaculum sp. PtaB.Bin104]|nr:MAG: putative teichuronic acid biosynthesis glycosyltransferase TuaH [Pelotomaculum sp. PtaB.Bin104]
MKYKAIICFSAIDWNYLKQRTQYLMAGMAERGLQVLFIENTGVRCPGFSDLPRVVNRIRNAAGQTGEDVPEGINIFSPLAIPMPYNNFAISYNKFYISLRIRKFLADNSITPAEVIFWTSLATPAVLDIMRSHSWGATVYDVVSDPKFIEPSLEPFEKEMTAFSDITLFASSTLREQYLLQTKNPVLFRDGFNTDLLKNQNHVFEMEKLPRPRFIYIGGINNKVMAKALETLAGHYRGGSVVLVGPVIGGYKIPSRENIYIFPPRRKYRELSGFLLAADAGLIPYFSDKYSGAMQPAKLNEYLVSGLPVVGTDTPELKKLTGLWGEGFFYLYDTPEKIAVAAEKALLEDSAQLRSKRQEFALDNTWNVRVFELLDMLDQF